MHLFRTKTEIAAMARPLDLSIQVIKEKSVPVMDCGASQTITGSLVNCKDLTSIETADGAEHMKSTHICTKLYFVRNRMGEVVTATVPALFVKGLPQDLPGGKSVNFANIGVRIQYHLHICEVN